MPRYVAFTKGDTQRAQQFSAALERLRAQGKLAAIQLYAHNEASAVVDGSHLLRTLQELWSASSPPLLISSQTRQLLCDLLEHAPRGAPWIEVRGEWLSDSTIYSLVKSAHQRGLKLVWRGDIGKLPEASIARCFDNSLLTLRPEDAYLQTVWPQSVYPVAARFGVSLKLPSVSPQPYTALAWQGYLFARAHGQGHAYNDRVLRAFFQQDRDIGRIDVLVQIAQETGLDAAAFEAALRDGTYREAHEAALADARALGIRGVPAFRIGGRWLPGVQTAQALENALREAAEVQTG